MDDVMRLALVRYGSERGFTARELRATVEEVAGRSMKACFAKAIESRLYLDKKKALALFGPRL